MTAALEKLRDGPSPTLDPASCYRALVAKDARFDGLFFIGVRTTGIYCRPVCPARKPHAAHCAYYPSAAAAEQAGFRPCLRCRPELAPATSPYREATDVAAGAVAWIQAGWLDDGHTVGDLAAAFGVSERHLRRLVRDATGASPLALAQTARLLLAKQLLTETELPIIRVAFDSGFSSLRRFNEVFAERYGRCPRDVRRRRRAVPTPAGIELRLAYRPPLAWRPLLDFHAARAIPGVERVHDGTYRRTVAMGDAVGSIAVALVRGRSEARVWVAQSLSPHLQSIVARVRHLFDLDAMPERIDSFLAEDPVLAADIESCPGLRVPGAFHGFELAWRAILGQGVSVAAASTLAGRLVARFGVALDDPADGLTALTPSAAVLMRETPGAIASIGIPVARARAIHALARLDQEHPGLLSPGSPPEVARARLAALPGVDPWTVEYVLMRALHWPDAFPYSGRVLRRSAAALGSRDLAAAAQRWRPWRAYATLRLWRRDERRPAR